MKIYIVYIYAPFQNVCNQISKKDKRKFHAAFERSSLDLSSLISNRVLTCRVISVLSLHIESPSYISHMFGCLVKLNSMLSLVSNGTLFLLNVSAAFNRNHFYVLFVVTAAGVGSPEGIKAVPYIVHSAVYILQVHHGHGRDLITRNRSVNISVISFTETLRSIMANF